MPKFTFARFLCLLCFKVFKCLSAVFAERGHVSCELSRECWTAGVSEGVGWVGDIVRVQLVAICHLAICEFVGVFSAQQGRVLFI